MEAAAAGDGKIAAANKAAGIQVNAILCSMLKRIECF